MPPLGAGEARLPPPGAGVSEVASVVPSNAARSSRRFIRTRKDKRDEIVGRATVRASVSLRP